MHVTESQWAPKYDKNKIRIPNNTIWSLIGHVFVRSLFGRFSKLIEVNCNYFIYFLIDLNVEP